MKLFPWNRKTDARKSQTSEIRQEQSGRIFVSPYCSTYENIFPQVRPLIDALKVVMPYGVGRNGAKKPLSETPELALLMSPNASMGRIEFLDLAFAMWLTESELNIHAWKDRRGHIAGYTILPPNCRVDNGDGSYYFQVTEANGGQTFLYPDEVMTLRYSRNPASPDRGVSPAQTVKIQTQIADMLYQYEAAFIENGAVPAYLTFIRAATEEKFLETKRRMENELQGPKNKGKTLFFWRQFLSNGQEKDQVEVKTIQPNNSTLAIKEIISIVKDDFNKAFGVSEFILGNDSSAKYDNAELSQQQFLEHRVKPALEAFWSQFQHELERVMGGALGYGIDWHLDVPELTERMKVKAETEKIKAETAKAADEKNKVKEETRKLQVENLTSLIASGARPEAAVKALGLSKEWLEVAYGILLEKSAKATLPVSAANFANSTDHPATPADEAEMIPVEEVPALQDPNVPHDKMNIHHDGCCTHSHDAKGDYEITFAETEVREKKIYEELMRVINSVILNATRNAATLTEKQLEEIKDAILKELFEEAGLGMNDSAEQIKGYLYGKEAGEIETLLKNGGYELSDEFVKKMEERTSDLVDRLDEEAKAVAKEVLNSSKEKGYTASQIETELAKVMPRARAAMIARNETVYAFRAAGLENAKNLAKEYGLKMDKIWHCHFDDRTCEICKAMDGRRVGLDESFPNEIDGTDGVQYGWKRDKWNDDGEVSSAHPRCRCYIQYKVIREGVDED